MNDIIERLLIGDCCWENNQDPANEIAQLRERCGELEKLRQHFENKYSEQCRTNLKIQKQCEEYDKALEMLSSGWAYVPDMHGFARSERARIKGAGKG